MAGHEPDDYYIVYYKQHDDMDISASFPCICEPGH
jgi:hypothetical protein